MVAKKKRKTRGGYKFGHLYPPKDLDEDLIAKFSACVRAGNFRYVACQRLGIPLARFKVWIRNGRKEQTRLEKGDDFEPTQYLHFLQSVERAEGEAHAQGIGDVMESGDPRLVFEFLRHRYNKLYSNNPNARVDDEDGTEHKIDTKALLLEKINALLGGE